MPGRLMRPSEEKADCGGERVGKKNKEVHFV